MSDTTDLHLDAWKTKPYAHQIVDTKLLICHQNFGLFNQMGCGKSATVINAACELFLGEKIDVVLVVAPASVRGVWHDPDIGEISKHSWAEGNVVMEFHTKSRVIWRKNGPGELVWVVTNYEILRQKRHRDKLRELLHGHKFMLVCDESSFIKSHKAEQTKACIELGQLAARRVILNGTPIGNSPMDLWSQMLFLDKRILPYKWYGHFRDEYCRMGGWHNKQITGYKNLDKLQNLISPHVVRREKKDCLDLPEKIFTHREVAMSEDTWKIYKTMRDELVVWMGENPSMAAQAGIAVMRLSQILSGFLGGFITDDCERSTETIGREKLDALREWVGEQLEANPKRKIIVWCRFRPELERVAADLKDILPTVRLYGQSAKERAETKLSFRTSEGPMLLAGHIAAGGFGLNDLVVSDCVAYLSNGTSLLMRLQSEDRAHRPGQKNDVLYTDFIAVGPKGQKTIDHTIVKALRTKSEIATWTVAAWKRALEEE